MAKNNILYEKIRHEAENLVWWDLSFHIGMTKIEFLCEKKAGMFLKI